MTTPTPAQADEKALDLLPCPFCGGPARTFRYNGALQASCAGSFTDCAGFDVSAPITMWNRRAALRPEGEAVAWRDVIAERRRQIEAEGWTPEHDDTHRSGEMADAAALYASLRVRHITGFATWPWSPKWWRPKDRRSDLVRAGALILAEIERLDRKEATR